LYVRKLTTASHFMHAAPQNSPTRRLLSDRNEEPQLMRQIYHLW